jgi:hypothetical protein
MLYRQQAAHHNPLLARDGLSVPAQASILFQAPAPHRGTVQADPALDQTMALTQIYQSRNTLRPHKRTKMQKPDRQHQAGNILSLYR